MSVSTLTVLAFTGIILGIVLVGIAWYFMVGYLKDTSFICCAKCVHCVGCNDRCVCDLTHESITDVFKDGKSCENYSAKDYK